MLSEQCEQQIKYFLCSISSLKFSEELLGLVLHVVQLRTKLKFDVHLHC